MRNASYIGLVLITDNVRMCVYVSHVPAHDFFCVSDKLFYWFMYIFMAESTAEPHDTVFYTFCCCCWSIGNDLDQVVTLGLGLVSVGTKMAGQANLCLEGS